MLQAASLLTAIADGQWQGRLFHLLLKHSHYYQCMLTSCPMAAYFHNRQVCCEVAPACGITRFSIGCHEVSTMTNSPAVSLELIVSQARFTKYAVI